MYRIAVIEDNIPTNDSFRDYLRKIWPDCIVEQFWELEPAIAAVTQNDFDLIVSDIDLGAGSGQYGGVTIAHAIDARRIPLLIVSGSPQPEFQRGVFRALYAWDYLQKPVTESDFRIQVERAMIFRLAQQQGEIHEDIPLSEINPVSDLVIDLHARKNIVTWQGTRVGLTMTQVRIVQALAQTPNVPVLYETLFDQMDTGKNKENLRVHIGAIREAFKSVDDGFDRLKTKPMMGYFWRD